MMGSHLAMLGLGFLGFSALAIGTERYAKHVLRVVPSPRWRLAARSAGWCLLGAALALGIVGLATAGVGIAVWLGWLSFAAIALVFALPKWPWQPPTKPRAERSPKKKAAAIEEPPVRASRRWVGWALLAATAGTFTIALARVETKPLQRDDAIHGRVGPWSFSFAEADRDGPEVADMDVPLKAYRLRFCEACDLDILRVHLKVNKPRAPRVSGVAFEGSRWERSAEIQLPANLTGASELWMTVVGKDGAVHQISWPMNRVSPTTVAWFERQGMAE